MVPPRRRPSDVYYRDSTRPYRRSSQNAPNRQSYIQKKQNRPWWRRLLDCIGGEAEDQSPSHMHCRHSPSFPAPTHEAYIEGCPPNQRAEVSSDSRGVFVQPIDPTPPIIRIIYRGNIGPYMTGVLPVIPPGARDVDRRGAEGHVHNIQFDPDRRAHLPAQLPGGFISR